MIDWVFLRASARPMMWEYTASNLNITFDPRYQAYGYNAPVNKKLIPPRFAKLTENIKTMNNLTGQFLEQFEKEEFKYVISPFTDQGEDLIIREYLSPEVTIDDTNSKRIDLNILYKHLGKYDWVAVGMLLSNVEISDKTVLGKSYFYTRNNTTQKLINLSADNHPLDHDTISSVTYAVFRKTKNPNIVICVLNPYLMTTRGMEMGVLNKKHRFSILNTQNSTIETFLLKPYIKNGILINETTIFAKDSIEFEEYGSSIFTLNNGVIPKFDRKIYTNLEYTDFGTSIKINLNKKIGYLKLDYDVGSIINNCNQVEKAGIHTVEYTIIKDE